MGIFFKLVIAAICLLLVFILVEPNLGFAISGLIFVFSMYFLPTLIADHRKSQSIWGIFLLNLLMGWTLIGWIFALVWSVSGKSNSSLVAPDLRAPTPTPAPAPAPAQIEISMTTSPPNPTSQSFIANPVMQKTLETNLDEWLIDRWFEIDSGNLKVPSWHALEVTQRQIDRLKNYGLMHSAKNRGQASDIIGLFEKPSQEDIDLLRFFKYPVRGMTQTKAQHICGVIRNDAEKMKSYSERAADPVHRRMYSFCGLKVPEKLTIDRFERDYNAMSEAERFSECISVWDDYMSSFEELQIKDVRDDYEIKRITHKIYDSAIAELIKSGIPPEVAVSDLDQIVEKIFEINPSLHKYN